MRVSHLHQFLFSNTFEQSPITNLLSRSSSPVMSASIVLYDFDNRAQPQTCWSYNVWKTRLVLNYKNIPYTTIWTNHTALGSTLAATGLPPKTNGSPYTVPTIRCSDASMVTESAVIAAKLEELHPSPTIHLDESLQAAAEKVNGSIAMPLFAEYMPRLGRDIIPDEALADFRASREKRFGMNLEELQRVKGGEKAWQAARPGIDSMKALLSEHKVDEGPFIRGSQVCYADFLLLALIESFRRVGEDLFERLASQDTSIQRIYDAGKQWLQQDN
ncbi:hypothetical protein AMS68_005071 [Peltaster fructicola]|uniref:Uncharacterized protein n=1 Tax=Peltaster fructicola TaxID=286661 RepID=A0A6H0XXU6_9PEZI|nr:hypothetical protein AMS68_005071 [Peltaster fructicola]